MKLRKCQTFWGKLFFCEWTFVQHLGWACSLTGTASLACSHPRTRPFYCRSRLRPFHLASLALYIGRSVSFLLMPLSFGLSLSLSRSRSGGTAELKASPCQYQSCCYAWFMSSDNHTLKFIESAWLKANIDWKRRQKCARVWHRKEHVFG